MERFVPLCRVVVVLAMALVMAAPAYAQISTSCTTSAISSFFTPCAGFLTSSSGNGTTPTPECCNAVKSLTSSGTDCLCLIVTGSVPFKIPINRTLAISLPRACNLHGVPVQCNSTGLPVPAPGTVSLGPILSPAGFTPSLTPQAPSLAPVSDTTPPSVQSSPPSSTTGSGRSNLNPSSAMSSRRLFPSVVLIALGFAVLKHY